MWDIHSVVDLSTGNEIPFQSLEKSDLIFSRTHAWASTDIANNEGTIFSYLPSNVRITLKSNESYCSSGWSGIDNIYINNETKSKEFTIKKDPNGLAPDEYTLTVDSGEGRLVLFRPY